MAKGLSLHIGLNSVDPKHYEGWSGELAACELDAKDMAFVAKSQLFTPRLLMTKEATRGSVTKAITAIAGKLDAGDIFFLTYSGHGGQIPDVDGDEANSLDETWCLYDGELLDDEIFFYLGRFAKGVRIFVLSDSCHSGSVLKEAFLLEAARSRSQTRYRCMPPGVPQQVYLAHRDFYDGLGSDPKHRDAQKKIKASALLISGCQDNQLSSDGELNGLFTAKLKDVWNGARFRGNYRAFHKAICKIMPMDQTPNLFKVGENVDKFELEKPFTI